MRQAWHIFKKDVRYLWLEIAMALVAAAAFALTAVRGTTPFAAVLPLVWWILIVRVVQAEPLPGVRQFWVTRPYAWKSLLAAKVLFIAVFVNLPVLIADVFILHACGFDLASQLSGLAWKQVLLTAAFALPVAALSAVTPGFVSLTVVSGILVVAAAVGSTWAMPRPWLALEWARVYPFGLIVAAAALAVVLLQYRRRDTALSRILAGGAVALALAVFAWLPWSAAFAVQSRLSAGSVDASTVRVDFHPDLRWAARAAIARDGTVELDIPLRLAGIPEPLVTRVDGITAAIEGQGGSVWREDLNPWTNPNATAAAFHSTVDGSFYGTIKDRPARISGAVYLTLYGNPRSMLLPIRDRAVYQPTPGMGLCAARQNDREVLLNCRSAFGPQRELVSFDIVGRPGSGALSIASGSWSQVRPVSYSPFPAEADLIPVTHSEQVAMVLGSVLGVKANALEPVAHIRKEFEITGLRLADYEVRP